MEVSKKDAEPVLRIIMHLLGIDKKSKDEVTEYVYNLINTKKFSSFYSNFSEIFKSFCDVTKKTTSSGHTLSIRGPEGVIQIDHDEETHKVNVKVYE